MTLTDEQWYEILSKSEVVYLGEGHDDSWYMIEGWEETSSPDCEPASKTWAYTRHFAKLIRVSRMPWTFNPKTRDTEFLVDEVN